MCLKIGFTEAIGRYEYVVIAYVAIKTKTFIKYGTVSIDHAHSRTTLSQLLAIMTASSLVKVY